MGTLKHILLVSLGLCSLVGFSQEKEAIPWASNLKLQWDNFKANPPKDSRVAAITASGISYQFSAIEKNGRVELDCEIGTYFYPNESWYRPETANLIILSHEQLHFDISELFARQMRERIREFSFTKNVKAEVKTIYSEILSEMRDFQELYDLETNFSRNVEEQLRWNTEIAAALQEE